MTLVGLLRVVGQVLVGGVADILDGSYRSGAQGVCILTGLCRLVVLDVLLGEHKTVADLREEVEAYRSADLGERLQDGPGQHSVIRAILEDALDLREEAYVVALVGCDGSLGCLLVGQVHLGDAELDEYIDDHAVRFLRFLQQKLDQA